MLVVVEPDWTVLVGTEGLVVSGGGVAPVTVTVMLELAVLPAASRATAVMVWFALVEVVLSQVME
jgi:hypothetical protein